MILFETTGLDWRIGFTVVAAFILISMQVYAAQNPQGKRFVPFSLIASTFILAAIWISSPLWRMLSLDAAALVITALVWGQNGRAGKLLLSAVLAGAILAGVGLALGGMLAGEAEAMPPGEMRRIVVGLILLGFAFKLAVIPFSFWLAPLAETSSPMTSVLVISLLDMAEFGELALLRVEAPWVFSSTPWLWLALALVSMFGGALLALGQKNLRRMLAFSTIDDMGYLLLGLVAGSVGGILGALIGALSHALCKFLLFASLGVAEKDLQHPVTLADAGLAKRHPLAGAAFIAGSLGMIGVPPFLGFLGRWRIYLGAVELGGPLLAGVVAVATALALLYYVRAIHTCWLGNGAEDSQPAPQSSRWISYTLIAGMALLVVAGLFPALLPGLGGR